MKQREKNQIEELYLAMYPMLYEYAYSTFLDSVLAEEAVQETFCIACQKPEVLCCSPNPRGWLVNTLKNTIRNIRHRQETASKTLTSYSAANLHELTAVHDSPEFEFLYHDITSSEEFRLLKELILEDKTYPELAQERNISVSACRKRFQRAKQFLRKKIVF